MPIINFISDNDELIPVTVESGTNVKDAALDNNINGIFGECGGSCTCATCHVYVDENWFDKIPQSDEFEQDMLEFAPEVTWQSRLSCQIKVDEALDGIKIIIPKRQY